MADQAQPAVRVAGLPPGVALGPLGTRFVAYLIDSVVVALIGALPAVLVWYTNLSPSLIVTVSSLLMLAWALLVWWMFAVRGAGPGMRLMHLQLVGLANGRPIGWGRFLVRQLIVFGLGLTGVGLLVMVILLARHPRRQGWHDLVVNSVVIKERQVAPSRRAAEPRHAVGPSAGQQTQAPVAPPAGAPTPLGPPAGYAAPQGSPDRAAPIPGGPPFAPVSPQYGPVARSYEATPPGQGPQPLPPGYPSEPSPGSPQPLRPPPGSPQPLQSPPGAGRYGAGHPGMSWPAVSQPGPMSTPGTPPPIGVPPTPPPIPSTGSPAPPGSRPWSEPGSPLAPAGRSGPGPTRGQGPTTAGGGSWRAVLDDGREIAVDGLVLLGRNPLARPGEEHATLIKVADTTRTVSKSHLEIGLNSRGLYVADRGSTNGSTVTSVSGVTRRCAPGDPVQVEPGSIVSFGDHWLEVRQA